MSKWLLQAYADYYDVMDLTEELVSGLVKSVKGSYEIQYHAGETLLSHQPSHFRCRLQFWPAKPV